MLFFQLVNDRGRTDLQHPCGVADTAAIETHIHDLLFDRGGASFVDEIELKGIMRTVGVLALIALVASFGLTTLDDLITVAVRTKHGNAYHNLLLQKKA